MPNNMSLFNQNLDSYCIGDITDLEILMDAQIVTIELDEPYEENGRQITTDEVLLKLDQVKWLENNLISNEKYSEYFIKFSKDVNQTSFQSLNYQDFINEKNDFLEVLETRINSIEEYLYTYLEQYISENLGREDYPRHLLNNVILLKISNANRWVETNYISDGIEEMKFHSVKRQPKFSKQLVKAMEFVYERQNTFVRKLREDFKYYYDKSPTEKFLEDFEIGQLANKSNSLKKYKGTIWYKLAEIVASGRIKYEKRTGDSVKTFYLDNKPQRNALGVAEKISESVRLKAKSIRPYIDSTFKESNSSDKNIFIQSHKEGLLEIKKNLITPS